MEEELRTRWKSIRSTYRGNAKRVARRRDILNNILKNTLARVSKKVLGIKTKDTTRMREDQWAAKVNEFIGEMETIVDNGESQHWRGNNDNELNDTPFVAAMKGEIQKFYDLPNTPTEWKQWWKHKSANTMDIIHRKSNRDRLTDTLVISNPKKLYKQICKRPQSTKISSLRKGDVFITEDEAIEKELTDYLTNMGRKHDQPPEMEKIDNPKPELATLMEDPTHSEMRECIADLDASSAAGHDQLVKALRAVTAISLPAMFGDSRSLIAFCSVACISV